MSEAPLHQTPAVDPITSEPAITAPETTTDTVHPTATGAPAVEDSKAEHEITPAGGVTALPPTTEGATESEAAPVTEGILGHKGPGLIKSFRFSKKYFWFGNEAVDSKSLATYLKSEKAEIAHPTAAHATQTGKGLLFYAKRVEDKAQPAGVLNLGIATDVVTEEMTDFSFKVHGHRHVFQAASKAERDGWLKAVETAAEEAKGAHEGITGSEGYKSHLASFAPVAAAVPAARSSSKPKLTTEAKDARVHDGALENEAVATGATTETTPKVAETKADTKSRSQSRKRQSIFGKVIGKKEELEEKREIKKEEKAEGKAEAKADTVVAGGSTLDAHAVAARVMDAPVATEDATTAETAAPAAATSTEAAVTPKPTKRGSMFGSIFSKNSPTTERKEKDVVPAVPEKDSEVAPVAPVAPQIDPVPTSASTEDAVPTAPAVNEPVAPVVPAPATTTEATSTATPPVKDKRRQSFFGSLGGKKEKSPAGDASGKGLTGLFRKASSAAKGGDKAPAPLGKHVPPVPSTTETTPATATDPPTNGVEHEKASEPTVPETTSTTQPTPIHASA